MKEKPPGHQENMPKGFTELEALVDQAAAKAKFPINDFEQLAQGLGGDKANVTFQGRDHNIGQAKHMVPKEFFPVQSREDLLAKSAFILIRQGVVPSDHVPGQQQDKPPANAGNPQLADSGPRPGGFPAQHGVKGKG